MIPVAKQGPQSRFVKAAQNHKFNWKFNLLQLAHTVYSPLEGNIGSLVHTIPQPRI